jgi:cell division protein FtsI/penicillin-binding protein 2
MLVKRLEDDQGRVVVPYHPKLVRQVVSESAARAITAAMKRVVSKEGTGKLAILDHHVAAGKTGTAKKVVGGVYSSSHHFSSFIGFFPADRPQVCLSVVMDEPKNGYYAAQTAAPVFKRIAEQIAVYLNIPPDAMEEAPDGNTLAARSPAPPAPAAGGERTDER